MRKFLIIATVGVVFAFFVFLVGFFVPAIESLLLWPGARVSRMLGISVGASLVVGGTVISWVLWAAVFAVMIAAVKQVLWPHRKLFWVCSFVVVAVLFFEARGTHNKEYEGTWEFGFGWSDFYPNGGCWRPPYWLEPTSELSGPSGKLDRLGNPSAVRVKFIGDATWVGPHGHLGGYMREIRVVRLIDVQAAQPCRKVEMKVEEFQPTSFGFNITVTVKNVGTKPLLLAEVAGRKGRLQSLDIQQWDEKRGWQRVGPCRDIAPISTMKLEPGESLQNIVSIGDRAHGWGSSSVCSGGVEHLGGRVRAILYYAYDSEEDFEKHNPKGRVDFVSTAVKLPGSTPP